MLIYIKRKIAAAHWLPDYSGPCSRLHGHTFLIEVWIEGPLYPATGMVADFKVVKDIIDLLDHRCLNDYIQIPTAENVAKHYFRAIPLCVKVRVWESDSCFAECVT